MQDKIKLIFAMLIWGSIGLFVKAVDLSSGQIAFLRGIIGVAFLLLLGVIFKQKISIQEIKRNSWLIILSGMAIGFNWIFLFEAYKYTSISLATISYYFAPIIVTILSPLLLKEKLGMRKIACVFLSMLGLICIMDLSQIQSFSGETRGILYGLIGACFYAGVVLMNKYIRGLEGLSLTTIQLFFATIVLLPYVAFTTPFSIQSITGPIIIIILIVGIVHTGIAYYLYFSSMQTIKGQTIAILSYLDPVSAIFFSTVLLKENITPLQVVGGVLILGATLVSSFIDR